MRLSPQARFPKVLFFINGRNPTPDELEEAKGLGIPNVSFRNAQLVNTDTGTSSLEECDAVAGDVPERYKRVYSEKQGRLSLSKDAMQRLSDYDRVHGAPSEMDNEAARGARPPSKNERASLNINPPRALDAWSSPVGGFPVAGQTSKASPTNEFSNDVKNEAMEETLKDFTAPAKNEGEADDAYSARVEEARAAELEKRKASQATAAQRQVAITAPQTEASLFGDATGGKAANAGTAAEGQDKAKGKAK